MVKKVKKLWVSSCSGWLYNLLYYVTIKLVNLFAGRQVENITFREYQTIVDDWIKEHGVRYFSEMTNLAQLMEEVGELARVMSRTYGDQSFKPSDKEISLADELADIFFVITCIANQTGIDMTGAIRKNLDKKTRRDSKRHKNNPKLVK